MKKSIQSDPIGFFDPIGFILLLVPNLQIGNLEGEALASQNGKLELPEPNSQAGAWELAQKQDLTPLSLGKSIQSDPIDF